ncbi:MFS transporter [Kineococcus rhizosphaerae]|uniref:EmrB/QacA subfamily drug resistance transporter n=1 Tax=Kineococcus rhizosphaerae TaxID=559628 RepID=A0A2T0R1E4_9ACTN|nr:MFS transporter [Kineococcus rhizosphaerae]PRY13389.1 EmrB/QacA subfamily drug resistance transporter [Kineococcus rhizosphaerae]
MLDPDPVQDRTTAPVRLRPLLGCLVITTALGALDQTIVATALPTIVADFDAVDRAAWVLTAYLLAMSVAMPVVGSLGDRYGAVRLLRASVVVFVAASVVCAAAPTVEALALARALQGVGGAGMLVLPQALVAAVVPARERAAVLGPLGAVFAVATVVGPLLGGWLTDTGSWRWVFWINLPTGGLALLLACTVLPAGPRPVRGGRFDVAGTALLVLVTSALAWTAAVVPRQGWGPVSALAVVGTLVVVAGFAAHQLRSSAPLLPVEVLRTRGVSLAAFLAGVVGFGMFGVIAYVPSWVQGVHGTSATVSGLLLLPVTAGLVTGVNTSGRLVRRTGRWRRYPVGGCALAALAATTLALAGPHLALPATAAVLVAFGLGAGSFMALLVVLAQDAAPPRHVAGTTGTIAYVREAGATVGTALLGGLLAAGLVHAAPGAPQALGAGDYGRAFTPVFLAVALAFVLGVVAAVLLPHRDLATGSPTD